MEDSILILQLEKLNELLRLKGLNDRLLDANENLLLRLTQLAQRSGIPIDAETMALVAEVRGILARMNLSDETLQRRKSNQPDGDLTVPCSGFC
jgi:hypothetical protein